MAAKTTPPNAAGSSSPTPGRPAWIAPTFTVLALVIVIVGLTQLLGHDDKASATSFSALNAALGVTILLLALARLAVRLIDAPPPYPDSFPKWERAVAVWTHRAFYFFIIALPVTGLAAVSKRAVDGWTQLVGGTWFPVVPIPGIGEAHEPLVFAMIALLIVHVLAALKNQFLIGGPVAGRMPPFRATEKS